MSPDPRTQFKTVGGKDSAGDMPVWRTPAGLAGSTRSLGCLGEAGLVLRLQRRQGAMPARPELVARPSPSFPEDGCPSHARSAPGAVLARIKSGGSGGQFFHIVF